MGSDSRAARWSCGIPLFQSTLPVWGATATTINIRNTRTNFNPRSPCGERQGTGTISSPGSDFNPRSPCGERLQSRYADKHKYGFQSTLPVWGATFNLQKFGQWTGFQSTLPVWGATHCKLLGHFAKAISIHAPRVGSDVARLSPCLVASVFQSTLPVWGATRCAPKHQL